MTNGSMIEVESLTKRYAGVRAVTDISFTVGSGEIVGLLGPNGAGKSTTMRILACYLAATSGTVRVAGLDARTQSEDVRRHIGYMPENNPLHFDLRVREYLKFRARLKGLGWKESRQRVDTVMEQCGLTQVGKRIIGQLSKGYRQRVGLADALVHEPELIILDEPTIGFDPDQILSVRQLIKTLARNHTVLISTHILREAELTCTRVMIMYQGRIQAADTLQNLQNMMSGESQVIAEIAAAPQELQTTFSRMAGIEHFDIAPCEGQYFTCSITARDGLDLREELFRVAHARNWTLRELTRSRHSLEDIYLRVTRADKEED
jgi:ABC-2 type transport system ATP-binding protein